MEDQETQIPQEPVNESTTSGLSFSEHDYELMDQARIYLFSISRWIKFFFVLTIISIVMMAICGLVFMILAPAFKDLSEPEFPIWVFGLIYFILAGIYVIPAIYMHRISTSAEQTLKADDNNAMVEFLKNYKSLLKFCGILTISMFALWIIAVFVFAIISIAMV